MQRNYFFTHLRAKLFFGVKIGAKIFFSQKRWPPHKDQQVAALFGGGVPGGLTFESFWSRKPKHQGFRVSRLVETWQTLLLVLGRWNLHFLKADNVQNATSSSSLMPAWQQSRNRRSRRSNFLAVLRFLRKIYATKLYQCMLCCFTDVKYLPFNRTAAQKVVKLLFGWQPAHVALFTSWCWLP